MDKGIVIQKDEKLQDPKGGFIRNEDGRIRVKPAVQKFYDLNRKIFIPGNAICLYPQGNDPVENDLTIKTFSCSKTLNSMSDYSEGHSLEEELKQVFKNRRRDGDDGPADPPGGNTGNNDAAAVYCGTCSACSADGDAGSLLRIIHIMKDALEILQTLHKAGYLLLNISTDNILLIGEKDRERLFLLPYNNICTKREIRLSPDRVYTINDYTAPEVRIRRSRLIGRQADLYSMTAVFYKCLTGKIIPPEKLAAPTPFELNYRESPILKGCPEIARPLLQQIIRKGLSVTLTRRYQSAAQMKADLSELESLLKAILKDF